MTLISIGLLLSKSESPLDRGIDYTWQFKVSDSFVKREMRYLQKTSIFIEVKTKISFLKLKLFLFSINCYLLYCTCDIPLYNFILSNLAL